MNHIVGFFVDLAAIAFLLAFSAGCIGLVYFGWRAALAELEEEKCD